MQTLLQNSTARALVFFMYDSADHVTGKTGLSPTVVISKNGASFASPSGAVSEIGNGFYKVAGNATDSNTLGTLALSATATGADQATMAFNVVAFAQDDAVRLGLSALPNAAAGANGGLPLSVDASGRVDVLKVNGTSQTARDLGASVLLSTGTGTGQLDFTSGVVKANLAQILGTALTETAGQIAAAFNKFFNIATPAATMDHLVLVDTVTTYTGNTPQTGDAYARLGAPAGASVSADVAATKALLPTALVGGKMDSHVNDIAAGAITASSIAADAITDAKVASDVTIASVTGSVGSVTGSVTVGTNNDKTGYSLSAAAVQAIWDALTSALTTAGSIGKWIVDKLDDAGVRAAVGLASANLDTQLGSLATASNLAAAKTVVDAIKAKTDNLPSDPADASVVADLIAGIATTLGTPADTDLATDIANISDGSAPTAAAVADAVCDELLSGHTIPGSAGAALSAASASGDPWATLVPGAYDDGTAGAALGRLNNTPAEAPVLVIPDPADDASLCTVYVYTEALNNVKRAGIDITFSLSSTPSKSERVLEYAQVTMTTDADGFAQIALQRTDALTPSGLKYIVNCSALGIRNQRISLEADTYDLATLIS